MKVGTGPTKIGVAQIRDKREVQGQWKPREFQEITKGKVMLLNLISEMKVELNHRRSRMNQCKVWTSLIEIRRLKAATGLISSYQRPSPNQWAWMKITVMVQCANNSRKGLQYKSDGDRHHLNELHLRILLTAWREPIFRKMTKEVDKGLRRVKLSSRSRRHLH